MYPEPLSSRLNFIVSFFVLCFNLRLTRISVRSFGYVSSFSSRFLLYEFTIGDNVDPTTLISTKKGLKRFYVSRCNKNTIYYINKENDQNFLVRQTINVWGEG